MTNENAPKIKQVADLGNNLSLWYVHLDSLREQDQNARVMPLEKFERLASNIKKDSRLESLPLVTPVDNGHNEFSIISGHHRTRAARAAGVKFIYVLSLDENLTKDQIISKQLAHNALSGYDDTEVLAKLYKEIDDINERLASGVSEVDFQIETPALSSGDIEVNFDFELLNILFLPRQSEHFDEIVDLLEPEAKVYLAEYKDFERVKNVVQEISKRDDIRNMSSIMARMLDIVEKYHENTPIPTEEELSKKSKHGKK